jgi:hypothetical protein
MSRLVIECRTRERSLLHLDYQLLDIPLTARFLRLLSAAGSPARMKNTVIVRSAGSGSKDAVFGRLRELVSFLAGSCPALAAGLTLPPELDQAALNALHLRFELFERDSSDQASEDVREGFAELNRQIHVAEGLLAGDLQGEEVAGKTFFSAETDPMCQEALAESDYDHLKAQLEPGGLYMGYYTVGKNFLTIYQQNDVPLVREHRVAPQTQANTQIVGLLGGPPVPLQSDDEIRAGFFRWWDRNRIDQLGYDRTSRPQLALGWFPLGRLAHPSCREALARFAAVEEVTSMVAGVGP